MKNANFRKDLSTINQKEGCFKDHFKWTKNGGGLFQDE